MRPITFLLSIIMVRPSRGWLFTRMPASYSLVLQNRLGSGIGCRCSTITSRHRLHHLAKKDSRLYNRVTTEASPIPKNVSNNAFSNDTENKSENPTLQWTGASFSNSEFAVHVLIDASQAPISVEIAVQEAIDEHRRRQLEKREQNFRGPREPLSALQLIALGSVWYLPSTASGDPSSGMKPVRLTKNNATALVLETGDYLRIHHDPRRFPAVHEYDWSKYVDEFNDEKREKLLSSRTNEEVGEDNQLPGILVAENKEKGWIVIDKPLTVPVHSTVDNSQENVANCLREARSCSKDGRDGDDSFPYVTTPQRLDQNTSGLLVVATTKIFAAYYAKLLRSKTEQVLDKDNEENKHSNYKGGIEKLYRCLVCLIPSKKDESDSQGNNNDQSVVGAVAKLKHYAETGKVMRHYLEPSVRAPKRFVKSCPTDVPLWPECLLKIQSVGDVCALVGSTAGKQLAHALWQDDEDSGNDIASRRIPNNCQAVVEIEVELLTGRTHQIRGQLATEGFPLVGDTQYGGSIADSSMTLDPSSASSMRSERLALQCCELKFVDPDSFQKQDGTSMQVRSDRWNTFKLSKSWWTQSVEKYHQQMKQINAEEITTLASDVGILGNQRPPSTQWLSTAETVISPELLPPRLSLSPGKNKYVLVKATDPNNEKKPQWFVKSAAPNECGGPYHGNVAQDLREWIQAAGFNVEVVGGGRIDYRPDQKQAVVYGFSYAFGKADHARAASLIIESSQGKIIATYDNSDDLY